MTEQDWEWIPNTRMGLIEFGLPVPTKLLNLKRVLKDGDWADDSHIVSYDLNDVDITVDLVDNRVAFVTSWSYFIFKGVNLIGKNMKDLETLLDSAADEEGEGVEYDDGDVRIPFTFTDLGLLVWMSDSLVASICCSDSHSDWDWTSP